MAYAEPSGPHTWRVRYRKPDGTLGSIPGFTSKTAAEDKADEINVDQRRGQFIDPDAGRTLLSAWAEEWFDALDVGPNTECQYLSLWRNHLKPDWGSESLAEISNLSIHAWAKRKRAAGYATTTVTTMVKLLSMMLTDAADERLIHANPYRPKRRGRRHHAPARERVHTTPAKVLRVALHAYQLAGPWAAVLIITGAWTGARWGELLGLQRHNLHLPPEGTGLLTVDLHQGSLLEISGQFQLAPPKTAESVRTISLPTFLTALLTRYLATHNHPHVFVTPNGDHPRRSNFSRRVMRPAADGTTGQPKHWPRLAPAQPGLTFHGLRHSHKTWLIADHVPTIAQARRLGHKLDNDIEEVYSHVAPEVEARLLSALEQRWHDALQTIDTSMHTPLLAIDAA